MKLANYKQHYINEYQHDEYNISKLQAGTEIPLHNKERG